MLLRPSLLWLLCVASLSAQEKAVDAAKKPLRVHVIGASVSGGFRDGPLFGAEEQGDSVTLQHLLKAWAGDDARATTHNTAEMTVMFQRPKEIGQAQIEGVKKAKPDVVIAVDFPFWFAYGHVQGDEATARKGLLAAGCELLAQLEMPVLLGDLPDMTGAAKRMLSPRQIPSPEILKALNEQLADFVKSHPNFHLVPLAGLVATMKDKGASLACTEGALPTPPGALLQEDRLHATRAGMALLGFTIQEPLRALFPDGHPLRARAWTFDQFVEAAGAGVEIEALRAKADAGAAGTGGGGDGG